MTAALPYWPRRMKAELAGPYCGVSKTKFLDGVKAGRYPPPIHDGGNALWYREDLDECMDRQKGTPTAAQGSEWMEAINGTH